MKRGYKGFTLIELMITVAIIGILAAIAYPSYIDQVRKSKRSDARSVLLEASNRQERYYTTQYEYADSMTKLGYAASPLITENEAYSVAVDNADAGGFQISAKAATSGQKKDACTTLTINQLGEKSANNTKPTSDISKTCW